MKLAYNWATLTSSICAAQVFLKEDQNTNNEEPIISIIMVTIGLSIFFQAIMNWMFGVFTEPFPQIFSSESLNIFGLNVQTAYLMSGLILMLTWSILLVGVKVL